MSGLLVVLVELALIGVMLKKFNARGLVIEAGTVFAHQCGRLQVSFFIPSAPEPAPGSDSGLHNLTESVGYASILARCPGRV